MNRKEVVAEVCRRLEERWWEVHFGSPKADSWHFAVSGDPFLMVCFDTTPDAIMRGHSFDSLSVTESRDNEDAFVEHQWFGFFGERKIRRAIRFAMQRQHDLQRQAAVLRKQLGREPTDAEMCSAMGLDPTAFK